MCIGSLLLVAVSFMFFYPTNIPMLGTPTPNPTLQYAFNEIDRQLGNIMFGSVAFNKPDRMKRDETSTIELLLSPSLPVSSLATQVVENGNFIASTAQPSVLIAPNGETVTIETGQIEVSPRMKVVLLPQDPEAFTVTEMHDNAEQVIGSNETEWRWVITARKEGLQTLELVIYQLVKYDGKEYWHEVETYKIDIVVEVSLGQRIQSLDWYWIAGFIITLIGAIIGVWKWVEERKKKPGTLKVEIVNADKVKPRKNGK